MGLSSWNDRITPHAPASFAPPGSTPGGFPHPFLVPDGGQAALGLRMPERSMKVSAIAKLVGKDLTIPVMEVASQACRLLLESHPHSPSFNLRESHPAPAKASKLQSGRRLFSADKFGVARAPRGVRACLAIVYC